MTSLPIRAVSMLLFFVVFHFTAHADRVADPREQLRGVHSHDLFVQLALVTSLDRSAIADELLERWQPGYNAMALDAFRVADLDGRKTLRSLLQNANRNLSLKKANKSLSFKSWNEGMEWLWEQEDETSDDYAAFKSKLYRHIDSDFAAYFDPERKARIRLDEIVWGGVSQDGIPPLRNPKMIPAQEARYLNGSDTVFGIEINGDVRAYPKRILAWHEMFVDTVGGIDVAGVYCTLCGSAILYETTANGTHHELGTSGFLYRSNKLMYDRATQSLWNTLYGEPVVGPLVGEHIALPRRSIVTTTWKAWKERHPDTTVLSLDTGYRRDYGEGVAYKNYFATDELMFAVPTRSKLLKNKQEVLAILFDSGNSQPLAIDTAFLKKNPIYEKTWDGVKFLALTDRSGANRIYRITDDVTFRKYDRRATLTDLNGQHWTANEDALVSSDGQTFPRLPAHRAFWFGWHANFPNTELIK